MAQAMSIWNIDECTRKRRGERRREQGIKEKGTYLEEDGLADCSGDATC
jgi:hypothetical protein